MDDLISRRQAVDALRNYLVGKNVPCDGTLTARLIENEVINKLPSAEPQERKTGRWIFNQYDANPIIGNWHCSECGKITIMPHDVCNFCPNCGCKMEVDT